MFSRYVIQPQSNASSQGRSRFDFSRRAFEKLGQSVRGQAEQFRTSVGLEMHRAAGDASLPADGDGEGVSFAGDLGPESGRRVLSS